MDGGTVRPDGRAQKRGQAGGIGRGIVFPGDEGVFKGYPAPRNPEYAYQLYRMAANLGNREASANMQRLAFKEGIRASSRSSTPVRTRIDNATLHLIRALPVTEETRDRLRYWLLLENHSSNS